MKVRYRPYNPEEGYFTFLDPEDIKKHNPLLKAIDSFVEEYISMVPFSQSVRNEFEGAPAVHPRMMLKVIFYSYAKGIIPGTRKAGLVAFLEFVKRNSTGV